MPTIGPISTEIKPITWSSCTFSTNHLWENDCDTATEFWDMPMFVGLSGQYWHGRIERDDGKMRFVKFVYEFTRKFIFCRSNILWWSQYWRSHTILELTSWNKHGSEQRQEQPGFWRCLQGKLNIRQIGHSVPWMGVKAKNSNCRRILKARRFKRARDLITNSMRKLDKTENESCRSGTLEGMTAVGAEHQEIYAVNELSSCAGVFYVGEKWW